MNQKKQLKQEYKRRPVTIGVFQIRNTLSDRIFLASGKDLPGIINRHRFQLQNGIHANSSLQEDWQQLGAHKFAFEILEELDPADAQFDVRKELEFKTTSGSPVCGQSASVATTNRNSAGQRN